MSMVEIGVKNVHLISGEDIIAKVSIDNETGLMVLTDAVMPTIMSDGQMAKVGLSAVRPWIDEDADIDIDSKQVLWMADLNKQMSDVYRQAMSPIQMASSLPSLSPRPKGPSLDSLLGNVK